MENPLQRHPRIVTALAFIATASALAYLGVHLFSKPGRPKSLAYFYNEKTGKLFSASDQLLPPIDTDSGPGTGVRAYVFSCRDSKDTNGTFIGFLEKFTPEGKAAVLAELEADHSALAMGFAMDKNQSAILVRSPADQTWHPKSSPEGVALMKAGKESGGCSRPVQRLP